MKRSDLCRDNGDHSMNYMKFVKSMSLRIYIYINKLLFFFLKKNMEILKFMNIFIIYVILTIVCNVNNQILITFGQYIPSTRYAASSGIIGDRLYVIGGQVSPRGTTDSS